MEKNIVDYIELHGKQYPDDLAFRYLLDGENNSVEYSYVNLRSKVRALAKVIEEKAKPGSIALLLYSPGPEFIIAFLACMYAQVIAVPAYPPIPRRLNIDSVRLELVCKDAHPQLILADKASAKLLAIAKFKESAKTMLNRFIAIGDSDNKLSLSEVEMLITEGLELTNDEHYTPAKFNPDQIAMLQYSSGSTGAPKGIMVTHKNLMACMEGMEQKIGIRQGTSWVSWLPHYHDMGLIGLILLPIVNKVSVTYLSPFAFMEKPLRWFRAITKYKAAYTCAPNFGYELSIKHYLKNPDPTIDLSSLDLMVCGAEPINPTLPERLYQTFKDVGFRRDLFSPVYGLAEHTLMVTGGFKGRSPIIKSFNTTKLREEEIAVADDSPEATQIISCGFPMKNHEVRIVNPSTMQVLPEGDLGEIWAKGPSVTKGYWEKPEITEATFKATTADGQGPFLRTGDMGFILDNELYIFGRIKDIIIVRGKKYAPQDIEFSVQSCHEGIRKGNVAAFGITVDQEEKLVVVAEKSDAKEYDTQEIFNSIIQAVTSENGISVYEIILIKPKTILKTTSGKIQRRATKVLYINHGLNAVANWKSPLAISKERQGEHQPV